MSRIDIAYPPDKVNLREVGLRDGLQLVRTWPSTAEKREWLEREHAAGVRHFEVGSFLPASRMPQFADVVAMIDAVAALGGGYSAALALNERGATDALETHVDEIVCVVSATEEHSQANMRRSRDEAIGLVRTVARMRDELGHKALVNAGISMAFGCSIAGKVEAVEVLRLAEACVEAGADLVGIADTVGFAGPRQVSGLVADMYRLVGDGGFIVHLHDTRGMGIANASAALDSGCRILDGSLGGLGGCPFAPGATGNVVFEDLVYLCETKGFATGIDLAALAAARSIPEQAMPGESFYGGIARAGPPATLDWRT
ncbi:hydroxymethylglutaryl-CoA lyase [Nitratireductor thuwali]|uniref:Hydroxymethylglutaryl-CoA lyase YngG n=1 Tax=Nitratireductor thuwali TaxID=2267699 RepID=A0ABY5MJZ1_9HYPH|nr:Hydroxymethylglutaryl-CoA lyase YngG [Nitratireductor thuwali]